MRHDKAARQIRNAETDACAKLAERYAKDAANRARQVRTDWRLVASWLNSLASAIRVRKFNRAKRANR